MVSEKWAVSEDAALWMARLRRCLCVRPIPEAIKIPGMMHA